MTCKPLPFALALVAATATLAAKPEQLTLGRFGTVTLYRNSPTPRHVAFFVSGDGGWNEGVVDMAQYLAADDTLVVGIDILHYLKTLAAADDTCSYVAADFEAASQLVQRKLGFPRYVPPVLVGYSSGATLVYAALVQAPPSTFKGAVSLGFCPDLLLVKPFCKGRGLGWDPGPKGKGVLFRPATTLEDPWIALQGTIDQVCDPPSTQRYAAQVPHGEVVMLPKVGHGYSVPRNWLPQFRDAFARVVGPAEGPGVLPARTAPPSGAPSAPLSPGEPSSLDDLPLVEVPAQGDNSLLAVILSGDGGWAGIDRDIGNTLAARGIPVVGLNSLQYFWTARTPDGAAADLARVLRHYLAAWNKRSAIVIGYSFGADVAPFLVNRLPAELRERVSLLALLGLDATAEFEFHVGDWLGSSSGESLPVKPELERLARLKTLCFFGADEKDPLCPALPAAQVTQVRLEGGHHFGGNYQAIADRIVSDSR